MGHPQPPTLIRTDSKTSEGIINGTMKQRQSKPADMNLNWIKDRSQNLKQLNIQWATGKTNKGDYTTKHHPTAHHQQVQPIYLYIKGKSPSSLQGCDRILNPPGVQPTSPLYATDSYPTRVTGSTLTNIVTQFGTALKNRMNQTLAIYSKQYKLLAASNIIS